MKIDRLEYFFGAGLERMRQAWALYNEGQSYSLAMYVAGVAVECMLRAFKMRIAPTFDEKHDLRRLLKSSGMLNADPDLLRAKGLTEEQARNHFLELQANLNEVYSLWANDYRFASESRLRASLKQRRLDRKINGDYVKANVLILLSSAQRFIDRGTFQWISSKENIQSLLTNAFPPPGKVRLEIINGDSIFGTITSDRFEGIETIDRVKMVWDILDRGLNKEERRHILMIAAATPVEELAYTA